jgi:ubiquinone/menaquinone biosynthesis C-methylase UbiE/uncharacterized protein YbaR (Trm112 family)
MPLKKIRYHLKRQCGRVLNAVLRSAPVRSCLRTLRTERFVLLKYDQLAGEKIAKYQRRVSGQAPAAPTVKDHQRTTVDPGEVVNLRHDHVAEKILRPLLDSNHAVLEMGAGELTTLVPMARRLADLHLRFSAVDLSWSRVAHGSLFARESGVTIDRVGVGNALHLPFADNSFDLVYTSHCLEQIPLDLSRAAAELCRVSKKWVVCMEPSYELGHPAQRRRMREKHYARRLDKVFERLGHRLLRHELLPFDLSPDNRSALYLVDVTGAEAANTPQWACPHCRSGLHSMEHYLLCRDCGLVYPVLGGIPCLSPDNGIVASQYSELLPRLEQA